MKFEYETLLSPDPIMLSIGGLRKPTLRDISKLTFHRYHSFLLFMDTKAKTIYKLLNSETDWDDLPEEIAEKLTVYDLILSNDQLQEIYKALFNFFFIEDVVFADGYFVLYKEDPEIKGADHSQTIHGVIGQANFDTVIKCIQQVCCIYSEEDEDDVEEPKFKNSLAKKMFEKMKKAKKEQDKRKRKQYSKDYALSNIISKVSNRHPSLNPINVWDLTVFQLIDSFNCLQVNSVYDIYSTRIAVWGDEKNTFDMSLWYKSKDTNK